VLFKNLNKSSKDVLTKDFPLEKPWEIEFKHSSKNPQFTQNASTSASGVLDSASTIKYVVKDTTFEGKVANNGGGHVDAKILMDKYVKGLNFQARAERRAGKATSDVVSLTSEYCSPCFHGTVRVQPVSASWGVDGVATYKKQDVGQLHVGGDVSGGLDVSSLKYAVGAAFVGQNPSSDCLWTVSVKTAQQEGNQFGKVLGNIHVSSLKPTAGMGAAPAELSAEVQYSLVDSKTSVVFGGLWYTDLTKRSFFKAKLNQDAKVDLSMTHRLSDQVTATLGAQLDGLKASHPDQTVKYGFKLTCMA